VRDVFVALIIIGREIAISALREWMAQIGASKSVAVHMIGESKTVAQMVAIPCLLFDGMLFGLIETHAWGVCADMGGSQSSPCGPWCTTSKRPFRKFSARAR